MGGKGSGRPSQPGFCSPAPVGENLRQVSQDRRDWYTQVALLLTGYFGGETPLQLT